MPIENAALLIDDGKVAAISDRAPEGVRQRGE